MRSSATVTSSSGAISTDDISRILPQCFSSGIATSAGLPPSMITLPRGWVSRNQMTGVVIISPARPAPRMWLRSGIVVEPHWNE